MKYPPAHDSKVFEASSAKRVFEDQQVQAQERGEPVFKMVADTAYRISPHIVKPFTKKETRERPVDPNNSSSTTSSTSASSSEDSSTEEEEESDDARARRDPVFDNKRRARRRAFNKKLNGMRAVVTEDIIGILKRRFPVLQRRLQMLPQNNVNAILACGVLHNLSLMISDGMPDTDEEPDSDSDADYDPNVTTSDGEDDNVEEQEQGGQSSQHQCLNRLPQVSRTARVKIIRRLGRRQRDKLVNIVLPPTPTSSSASTYSSTPSSSNV